MNKSLILIVWCAVAAGCTDTPSSAADVNRPGTWNVTFAKLVDLSGPPYTEQEPAPEYPARVMTAPTVDPSGCTPGCTCEWATATDECDGDVETKCRAIGGFTETCHDFVTGSNKILDCTNIYFDSDTHTAGVCVHEDTRTMDEFGYQQLGRYWITLDRASY